MTLQILWFCLIAVFWAGYFLLEGFDFGVGMLLPFLPRDEGERSVMFRSIGPVWDGNEVWLVVAGASTFATFPAWYATMFSGFYLALLLILFLLIVRVVSFEWRSKSGSQRWRTAWLRVNALASTGIGLVWGIGLANLLHGLPLDSNGDYSGTFADLFSGYTVLAGIAFVLVFAFHGAAFLTLRTTGDLCERARGAARTLAVPAVASSNHRQPPPPPPPPGAGGRGGRGVPDLDDRGGCRRQRQGGVPRGGAGRDRDRRLRSGRLPGL
jgi:cytochrome bd ubiquinol oxidase subunit II